MNLPHTIARYKAVAAAVVVSAAVHTAVFVGMPPRLAAIDDAGPEGYSASLDPAATVVAPAPAPAPRRAAKPRPRPRAPPAPPGGQQAQPRPRAARDASSAAP